MVQATQNTLASLRGLSLDDTCLAFEAQEISTYKPGSWVGYLGSLVSWTFWVEVGKDNYIYVGNSWLQGLGQGHPTQSIAQFAVDQVRFGKKMASITFDPIHYDTSSKTFSGTFGDFRKLLADLSELGIFIPPEAKDIFIDEGEPDTYELALEQAASTIATYQQHPIRNQPRDASPGATALYDLVQRKVSERETLLPELDSIKESLLTIPKGKDPQDHFYKYFVGEYGHYPLQKRLSVYKYLLELPEETPHKKELLEEAQEWMRSTYKDELPLIQGITQQALLLTEFRTAIHELDLSVTHAPLAKAQKSVRAIAEQRSSGRKASTATAAQVPGRPAMMGVMQARPSAAASPEGEDERADTVHQQLRQFSQSFAKAPTRPAPKAARGSVVVHNGDGPEDEGEAASAPTREDLLQIKGILEKEYEYLSSILLQKIQQELREKKKSTFLQKQFPRLHLIDRFMLYTNMKGLLDTTKKNEEASQIDTAVRIWLRERYKKPLPGATQNTQQEELFLHIHKNLQDHAASFMKKPPQPASKALDTIGEDVEASSKPEPVVQEPPKKKSPKDLLLERLCTEEWLQLSQSREVSQRIKERNSIFN